MYRTRENFGGRNFWRIITDEAIGEENFGKSTGCLSVIPVYLYWQGKFGKLCVSR